MGIKLEKKASCLHAELTPAKKARFWVYASNCCDSELDEIFQLWTTSPNEVSVAWSFSIPFMVEDTIEMRRLHSRPELTISADDKPLFDAMRRDFAEAIERIDALNFED